MNPISMRSTERGFTIGEFVDHFGAVCVIQESSCGDRAAIWLGVRDPDPKVCVPDVGFVPVDLKALVDGQLSINTRMHLTVEMVQALLPLLHHFVETGGLPLDLPGPHCKSV